MPQNNTIGWHVLYVRSCQEKKIHTILQDNQLESFLPLVKAVRQWSDRKKTIFKPLFPSYVFVNIDSTLDFHKVLSLNGACGFVRFGTHYATVPDKEINQIKFIVGMDGFSDIKSISRQPLVGETYKIVEGPLLGLECEVQRTDGDNKVLVWLNSIRQSIQATLPNRYLSKLAIS